MADRFDVAIVGASIAGCTAARLFAQAGAKVALVERRPDPAAYKVVCTHAILSSATPTIERLGLAPLLEARGALRTHADVWTPYSGWFSPPDDVPSGWGVTRRTLDPMLRELAVGTPGVQFLPGWSAVAMREEAGRPVGIEVESRDHKRRALGARMVVGADGRGSTIARLARVPGRVRPHNRFFYFAYFRGVRPRRARVRAWMLDPDASAQFPNEDDLTLMVAGCHRSRLTEFQADAEGAYARHLASLPDAPDLASAERVSKLIGKIEMPNVRRPAARPGVAFVGDAAQASDPLWGVGCGWAFQTAEWLVDETAPGLLNGGDLDGALDRYRRVFARRLGLHHFLIADFATGRGTRPWERWAARAAAADEALARAADEVTSRRRSPLRLLDPRLAPHVVCGLARARRNGEPLTRPVGSGRAAAGEAAPAPDETTLEVLGP